MVVTMNAATFMGKNFQDNQNSIMNTTDLTMKKMFDISAKLVSEHDEISGLETIGWENHSWKYLSLIGDERVINHERTKVYVFSDSVLCWCHTACTRLVSDRACLGHCSQVSSFSVATEPSVLPIHSSLSRVSTIFCLSHPPAPESR